MRQQEREKQRTVSSIFKLGSELGVGHVRVRSDCDIVRDNRVLNHTAERGEREREREREREKAREREREGERKG